MKEKTLIKIIYSFFLLVSIAWVLIVPPFQVTDEQAHLRYTEYIAQNKKLPTQEEIQNTETLSYSPKIELYIEEMQADRIFHNINYHFDFSNPQKTEIDGFNSAHLFNHPPLYYIWGALLYLLFIPKGIGVVLYAIRFSNLLFSSLSFLFAYKSSKLLSKSKWFRIALTVGVSFWPMFMLQSSGVNNDVLLFTTSNAAIYYLLKVIDKKAKESDFLKLGLWMLLGTLTKANFIIFWPFYLLVLTFKFRSHKSHLNKRRIIIKSILLLIPVIIFTLRNFIEFDYIYPKGSGSTGIVLDNKYSSSTHGRGLGLITYLRVLIVPRLVMVYKRFIASFGWLTILGPRWIYEMLLIPLFFVVIGFAKWFIKMISNKFKPQELLMLGLGFVMELIMTTQFLRAFLGNQYQGFPTQGRYYFPVILPIFTLGIWSLKHLIPKRFTKFLYWGLFSFVMIFNSFSLVLLIHKYYL